MKETVIKRAKNYYNNCELLLSELCSRSKEFHVEFDEIGAITDFNVIMLSLLFSQAISDDDFCEEEKEFIKSLPNADSFFDYFVASGEGKLSWDRVFSLTTDDQKDLSEELNILLESSALNFVKKFSAIDSVTAENYIDELSINLTYITLLFSRIDGETTSNEHAAFKNAIGVILKDKLK